MKILIVDDIEANRKLLRVNLQAEGIDTLQAGDGVEALAALESGQPDAIISDILMPRMDGFSFCREVRRHERLRHTPFIFYTSTYITPGDESLAMKCGADRYLKKPIAIKVILSTIAEISDSARPRAQSPDTAEESLVMREYNQTLVRKLEERNLELETARVEIEQANHQLERRVEERTAELLAANQELEAFSQSVAHDLRSPLMAIDGFSQLLLARGEGKLDAASMDHLHYICRATRRMHELTSDLLRLARANRTAIVKEFIDLSALAWAVSQDLGRQHPGRRVRFDLTPGMIAYADKALLRIAVENLLNNAWKFTGTAVNARIEFGLNDAPGERVYSIRDNGAGFDMARAGQLFLPFGRLHSQSEFPGTGIGLSTVQRIVRRHGGRIWAEARERMGATFFFTLGPADRHQPS